MRHATEQTRTIRRLSGFLSLDRSGWIQFQHALIRDVAYAGLPFRTRQDLHARVGDSIFAACDGRPEEFAELLSLHYFYAKRWSRSWLFSQMAGDRAKEIYANHEAAIFYERALQSAARLDWVEPSERAGVLTDLAKVQYEAGSYEEAMPFPAGRRSGWCPTTRWPGPTCDSIWLGATRRWAPSPRPCARRRSG